MTAHDPFAIIAARPVTLYLLRLQPLWEGDAECIELGSDLQEIVARIERERSVTGLLGGELKPMRYCVLEVERALCVEATGDIFHARERTPVWKVMVPASGIYSRDTIHSCLGRGAGRNTEKYETALFHYPQAREFYTYSSSEIRPVDEGVFVLEQPGRPA